MVCVPRSLHGALSLSRLPRTHPLIAATPVVLLTATSRSPVSQLCRLLQRTRSASTSTRSLHSSSNQSSPSAHITLNGADDMRRPPPEQRQPAKMAPPTPLAVLPLAGVMRSLMTLTVSSSPFLLTPALAVMSVLANTAHPLLNPDRNPILRWLLKKTFYAQFCAGENASEVQQTIESLKRIGFGGVILGYAKEVVLTEAQIKDVASCGSEVSAEEHVRTEIMPWAEGTMETVRLASPGDFVALKFTGAGRQALHALSQRLPPTDTLASAIDGICQLAASRGVRLLLDAEQQALQPGIDDWSLALVRKYNAPDRAVVYGTYQAYLKAMPATLARHLAAAREGNFALGVKLVRGAYLGSDPRHLIHDTKADTDAAYDAVAAALLRREWNAQLRPPTETDGPAAFPRVSVVLATHNRESVLRAQGVLAEKGGAGGAGDADVAFAQLQGMADEVSCELVAAGMGGADGKRPGAYKYLVWGSTGECMRYLLRRARENRDAVQRTRDGRDAMRAELLRRVRSLFGIGK